MQSCHSCMLDFAMTCSVILPSIIKTFITTAELCSEKELKIWIWGGEGGVIPTEKRKYKKKKNNRNSLIFCAHALYKISNSWLKWSSSFNTNKTRNGQVRGITLPMFYRIQSKVILTWILNNLLNFRILAQAILYILC